MQKMQSSRADKSATHHSRVMKTAHAQLYIYMNSVCKLQVSA